MQHVLLLVLLFALPIIVKARASLTVNIANIGALVLVLVETLVRLVVVVDPDRLVHVVEAVRELVLPVLLALLLVLEAVLVVLDHHSVLLDVTHLVRTPLVDLLVLLTVPVILVRLLAEAHVLMLVV